VRQPEIGESLWGEINIYQFAQVSPRNSASEVWRLQQFLLAEAESRLGPMDRTKKLYQPIFKNGRPHIINTPSCDGAFASLSQNAAGYWPTTLYELAHETIHLLNPVVGYTNYLEEGVAVAFSVEMSRTKTTHAMEPDDNHYKKAWELVLQLPGGLYETTKSIRNHFGSLGKAEPVGIRGLFPDVPEDLAMGLCQKCYFT